MKNEKKIKFNFEYDKENDVLSVFDLNSKVNQTVEFQEFLNIDLDKHKKIVGFEFFDLAGLNKEATKKFLSNLTDVEATQQDYGRNSWSFILVLKSNDKIIQQPMPLFSYTEYKSPLLASCQ